MRFGTPMRSLTAARSSASLSCPAHSSPKFQELCTVTESATTQWSVPPLSTTTSPAFCKPTRTGTPWLRSQSGSGHQLPSAT